MEQWKDIIGFEGKYQVSDLGRVKSLNYHREGKGRVLVGNKLKSGYLRVCLWKDGKMKNYLVHRLVTEAFLPNPDNLPQVNHKDECKTNNAVSNLEWCDVAYNNSYGTKTERIAKALTNHPTKSRSVFQYTLDGSLVRLYPSAHEAERMTGYPHSNISACCNGKYKTMYGFVWSYTPINNKRINLF